MGVVAAGIDRIVAEADGEPWDPEPEASREVCDHSIHLRPKLLLLFGGVVAGELDLGWFVQLPPLLRSGHLEPEGAPSRQRGERFRRSHRRLRWRGRRFPENASLVAMPSSPAQTTRFQPSCRGARPVWGTSGRVQVTGSSPAIASQRPMPGVRMSRSPRRRESTAGGPAESLVLGRPTRRQAQVRESHRRWPGRRPRARSSRQGSGRAGAPW